MDSEKAEKFENLLSTFCYQEQGFPIKALMMTCKECGALVIFETRKLHLEWHDRQSN